MCQILTSTVIACSKWRPQLCNIKPDALVCAESQAVLYAVLDPHVGQKLHPAAAQTSSLAGIRHTAARVATAGRHRAKTMSNTFSGVRYGRWPPAAVRLQSEATQRPCPCRRNRCCCCRG